jgi:hypothetical protein
MFLSFSRFGSAFGLAIQTIIREAIQSSAERKLRVEHNIPDDAALTMSDEKYATWKGLQAALWTTAAFLFVGEPRT